MRNPQLKDMGNKNCIKRDDQHFFDAHRARILFHMGFGGWGFIGRMQCPSSCDRFKDFI